MANSRFTPSQLIDAEGGLHSRANTQAGTPERSAVYFAERLAREARGKEAGLTKRAALGHAPKGEATASDVRAVKNNPDTATLEQLKRVALANARLVFKEVPHFDEKRTRARINQIDEPIILLMMSRANYQEWADLARPQLPDNPFYYG